MSAESSGGNSKAPGRPFQKGKSGNPGGRPKGYGKFRREARRIVDEKVIAFWESCVASGGDDAMEASKQLAAYGYGKAPSAPDDNAALRESGARPLVAASSDAILDALKKGRE